MTASLSTPEMDWNDTQNPHSSKALQFLSFEFSFWVHLSNLGALGVGTTLC